MHSAVAEWMGLEAAKPLGRVAMRGMAKCPQRYHATEKRMVQIWGEGVRAGIIPCTDKQLYWFITRKSQPQGTFSYRIPTVISIKFMYCAGHPLFFTFMIITVKLLIGSADMS